MAGAAPTRRALRLRSLPASECLAKARLNSRAQSRCARRRHRSAMRAREPGNVTLQSQQSPQYRLPVVLASSASAFPFRSLASLLAELHQLEAFCAPSAMVAKMLLARATGLIAIASRIHEQRRRAASTHVLRRLGRVLGRALKIPSSRLGRREQAVAARAQVRLGRLGLRLERRRLVVGAVQQLDARRLGILEQVTALRCSADSVHGSSAPCSRPCARDASPRLRPRAPCCRRQRRRDGRRRRTPRPSSQSPVRVSDCQLHKRVLSPVPSATSKA